MPWSPTDAERHTRKASTEKLQRMWADVANSTLERTGNEGLAVREANGVVRDHAERDKRARRKKR